MWSGSSGLWLVVCRCQVWRKREKEAYRSVILASTHRFCITHHQYSFISISAIMWVPRQLRSCAPTPSIFIFSLPHALLSLLFHYFTSQSITDLLNCSTPHFPVMACLSKDLGCSWRNLVYGGPPREGTRIKEEALNDAPRWRIMASSLSQNLF